MELQDSWHPLCPTTDSASSQADPWPSVLWVSPVNNGSQNLAEELDECLAFSDSFRILVPYIRFSQCYLQASQKDVVLVKGWRSVYCNIAI